MYGVIVGSTDVEQSFVGKKQAKSTGKWIICNEKIDYIYTSGLKRAISTGEIIAMDNPVPQINSPQLNELDFGLWEGKRPEEIMRQYPEKYVLWETMPHLHTIPQGECFNSFQKRLINTIENIIASLPGKTICVVTHAICIRVIMCYFKGFPLSSANKIPIHDNAAISIIEFYNGKYTTLKDNFTGHMDDDLKAGSFADINKLLSDEWRNNKLLV